jgi:predicted dienelactone hydrolase
MGTRTGARNLTIADPEIGIEFPTFILYPSGEPSGIVNLGPFSVEATRDAQIRDGVFPIAVISHGTGGNHLGYLGFAQYLADHGFIIAMPEHYGNNRTNNSLEGTTENLEYRPRHISLVIDAIIEDTFFRGHTINSKAAIIGHSMGGYTALAVAGGEPWSEAREKVAVHADERVKAIVLLAPATDWYTPPKSLGKVKAQVLMLTAEHDPHTPASNAERVLEQIPHTTHRQIPNAGHFSFLSPFPTAMTNPGFPPSTDPAGFNREEFHQTLAPELRKFLQSALNL